MDGLTRMLLRLEKITLPYYHGTTGFVCFSLTLPSLYAEYQLITGLDSLLPLIRDEYEEFFGTYTRLRESCSPTDSNVCHWPVTEFQERLEKLKKDVLLVNFVKGVDCLDAHRKRILVEYFIFMKDQGFFDLLCLKKLL